MKNVPPMPPGWNLTSKDLFAEMQVGKRSSIQSPEGDWAREYELSLLPPGIRFPREGDVYEAIEELPVRYFTRWALPFTGGGDGVLRQGERIIVTQLCTDQKPLRVYALPVDYDGVQRRMVPELERAKEKYRGFYLYLETVALNLKYKLVDAAGEKQVRPAFIPRCSLPWPGPPTPSSTRA